MASRASTRLAVLGALGQHECVWHAVIAFL
jgi:hypothetical protein